MCAKKNWARVFSVLQRTHKFQVPLAKHLIPSHAIFNFICNVLACSQGLGKRDNLKLFDSIMTVKTLVVSLGSKRFQSSYWTKVRAGAKKNWRGKGRGEEEAIARKPTILESALWYFTVRFICKLTARQDRSQYNEQITRFVKCTLFSSKTRSTRLKNCNKEVLR